MLISFEIVLSSFILTSHGLSTSSPPGANFDLTNFYLTLPTDDDDTISAQTLTNGYDSTYFYTDPIDGSMTFYVPEKGDEIYPSCELHEQCMSGTNDYAWDLKYGTHQLNGQYQVANTTTSNYFIIQQIYSINGPDEPLLKVRYHNGYIRTELSTNSKATEEQLTLTKEDGGSTYVGNNKFWLKIIVSDDGEVKVWLDGDKIIDVFVAEYWGNYLNYFKTGCQKTQQDSEGVEVYLKVYSLTVHHSDNSTCKDVDEFVSGLGGEDDGKSNSGGIIAAVIILIIFVICVFGVCWYYKKKHLPQQGQVSFASGDGTGDDGGNEDEKKAVKSGGYDMEPIDVEKDVDVDGNKGTED